MRTMNEENYGMGLLLHFIHFVPLDANEGNCDAINNHHKKPQCTNQSPYTESILSILKHYQLFPVQRT